MSENNFKEIVYRLTREIPLGQVATYGQLARLAGHPGAARAVGMCMRMNPEIPSTPCHRVVGSDGSLVGYSAGEGVRTKKAILLAEGVIFKGEKVDLLQSIWLPANTRDLKD